MPEKAPVISVEDLTQAAFAGVLTALEVRGTRPEEFPGPILVGIIAWPELSKVAAGAVAPVSAPARARSGGKRAR